MAARLRRLLDDDDGATAIEYSLIAALIAVSLIAAMTLFGDIVVDLFHFVRDRVLAALASTAG